MSTDFTGLNASIDNDSLMRMSAAVIGRLLNIDRDMIYQHYKNIGKCSGNGSWGYYDRYEAANAYTGNKLDDLVELSAAVSQSTTFNSKDPGTAESRRNLLKGMLSDKITVGRCDDITSQISTGMIPHLDIPDTITILMSRENAVCEESGVWDVLTPVIDYTDSCGCGRSMPVPHYPDDYQGNILEINGESEYIPSEADFTWNILKGADDIIISDATASKHENTLEISTKNTAFLSSVEIEVSYAE